MERWKRPIWFMFLSVLMTLALHTSEVRATDKTVDDTLSYVDSLVGQTVGNGQCVGLIKQLYNYLGVSEVSGNACDYATNSLPSGWSRVEGGVPQAGDILVYTGAKFGHIVIYAGDNTVYHQNWSGQYVQKSTGWNYNKSWHSTAENGQKSYWGYIRPDYKSNNITPGYISGSYAIANTPSTFWWDPGEKATSYVLKIWRGSLWEGDPCRCVETRDLSCQVTLSTGHYEAYVDYCDDNGNCIISRNTLSFDIPLYTIDNEYGDDFFAYIIASNENDIWRHTLRDDSSNVTLVPTSNDSTDPRQIWHFMRASDNTYTIYNCYNGSALTADAANTGNNANVHTASSSGGNNQKWYIVHTGTNRVTLKPVYSDCVLNVSGSLNEGSNINLYNINQSAYQDFSVYKLSADNVTYEKPARPDKVTLTIDEPCVVNQKIRFSWTAAPEKNRYDSRYYDIRIFKDGKNILTKMGIKETIYDYMVSEPGSYTATIAAVNSKYDEWYTFSDEMSFVVLPSQPVDLGTDFDDIVIYSQDKSAYVDVDDSTNPEKVVMYPSEDGGKLWDFYRQDNGTYKLRTFSNLTYSMKVVDIFNGDKTAGTNAILFPNGDGYKNQSFYVLQEGDSYRLISAHTYKALGTSGTSLAIQLCDVGSDSNQLFYLEKNAYTKNVEIDKSEASIEVAESLKLHAYPVPSYATNCQLDWRSENEDIAVVTNDGMVVALKEGKAVIIVEDVNSGCFSSCIVTVTASTAKPDAVLPSSLTTIDERAFEGASFTFVVLGDETESIGSKAFANCKNLRQIYIPPTTTKIADDAFENVDEGLVIRGNSISIAGYYANKKGYFFIPSNDDK